MDTEYVKLVRVDKCSIILLRFTKKTVHRFIDCKYLLPIYNFTLSLQKRGGKIGLYPIILWYEVGKQIEFI